MFRKSLIFCDHLLTHTSFQNYMTLFLDILTNIQRNEENIMHPKSNHKQQAIIWFILLLYFETWIDHMKKSSFDIINNIYFYAALKHGFINWD